MTAAVERQLTGAPSNRRVDWNSIDWKAAHRQVHRLQMRLAKAVREQHFHKAKALQWLLTHSFYAKALAVRRVMTNRGRRSPGVDGVVWNTPQDAEAAVRSLRRRGYRPQPRRRVYLPKPNGTLRPLGIPTRQDRAMEALYKLSLDPVAETLADPNSYGFRDHRSTADAMAQCFIALAKGYSAPWVLDADIRACFDRLDHTWLLRHILMDTQLLQAWLNAGDLEADVFHAPEEGTPQGGIASPVLANMALDGLEAAVYRAARRRGAKVNVIRYADDFIVTAASQELLSEIVVPVIRAFLAERGLELSTEKTRLVHIEEGFDFLGFNVRKYRGKRLIQPAQEKVRAFLRELKELIKSHIGRPAAELIRKLNAKLRGWGHYYRHVVAKQTFGQVDREVANALRRWARRRHPHKPRQWIHEKYFRGTGEGRWAFGALHKRRDGTYARVDLFQVASIPIRRHVKIQAAAHPYDPQYTRYFRRRWAMRQRRRDADRRHFVAWRLGPMLGEC